MCIVDTPARIIWWLCVVVCVPDVLAYAADIIGGTDIVIIVSTPRATCVCGAPRVGTVQYVSY